MFLNRFSERAVEYLEIDLLLAGAAYVESRLQQGTGLCSDLLARFTANDRFFAPAPSGTSLERAQEFETGGLMLRDKMKKWLAGYLQTMRRSMGAAVVFHDVWAKPEDFEGDNPSTPRFFADGNVYYYMNRDIYDVDSVSKGLEQITSYLMVGAIVSSKIVGKIDGEIADARLVEEIAHNAQSVFVSAYDQEGLVVWERTIGKA